MAAMRASPCVRIEAGLETRVTLLLDEYRHFLADRGALDAQLDCLVGAARARADRGMEGARRARRVARVRLAAARRALRPGLPALLARNFSASGGGRCASPLPRIFFQKQRTLLEAVPREPARRRRARRRRADLRVQRRLSRASSPSCRRHAARRAGPGLRGAARGFRRSAFDAPPRPPRGARARRGRAAASHRAGRPERARHHADRVHAHEAARRRRGLHQVRRAPRLALRQHAALDPEAPPLACPRARPGSCEPWRIE